MPSLSFLVPSFCILILASGCGPGGSTASAPSCDELLTEYKTCQPVRTQGQLDTFNSFCASPRASDSCRSCLKGKLCGVTESCDPACGK